MNASPLYIKSFCTINQQKVSLNGKIISTSEALDFKSFTKKVYQDLGIQYPKFFKMDNLSKLAFLGAEAVLQDVSDSEKEHIALVFANQSSSLDTDLAYQESISDSENYYPSPAVFVYTLPNICLGEISIKHQLKSEHAFFIFDTFNAEFIIQYARVLIQTKKADKVLCGWVEYLQEDYKAFLFLVDQTSGIEITKNNVEKLFK